MIFEGPGDKLEILWLFMGTLGGPGSRLPSQVVVKSIVRGV